LTGAEATKAALLSAGGDCAVLHIATHGYADPDVPEFSGLLLAGAGDAPFDVLTAMEVYTWPLKARLVTLSACQTALGRNVEGEGILGLSRAFIYAGAQDVVERGGGSSAWAGRVASVWREGASVLLGRLHRRPRPGVGDITMNGPRR